MNELLNLARSLIGTKHNSSSHKNIVDIYNSKKPLPVGYKVSYTDDWCDVFITYLFDSVGLSDLIGRECGVQRHLNIFKSKGIWKGRVKPQAGDIIVFDWQGHSAGWADHIGIVEKVSGNTVTTIEGNTGNPRQVKRKSYVYNHSSIVGYARPNYNQAVKKEEPIKSVRQIKVDGYLGKDTVTRMQEYFKMKYIDGVLSGQSRTQAVLAFEKNAVHFGSSGSNVVRALQKLIKCKLIDGKWGAETTTQLQKYLGTPVDGIISKPSMAIRELQRRLNNGTF